MEPTRCHWPIRDPLMIEYHDREWGEPVHDDRALFEHLVLDGAQAGLSWRTILHKREGYRRAFDNFDMETVARYDDAKIETLLGDPGIVRNRKKIESARRNARAALTIQEEFGSLDAYFWSFVGDRPIVNAWKESASVPATSPESDALSRDLKRRGMSFVGSTIVYAMMQAAGLVNDHLTHCFRYKELAAVAAAP